MQPQNGHRSLDQLRPGERGVIAAYRGSSGLELRLRELGLLEGTLIKVERLAPFGDPMELIVRGYRLSLRRADAAQILIAATGASAGP